MSFFIYTCKKVEDELASFEITQTQGQAKLDSSSSNQAGAESYTSWVEPEPGKFRHDQLVRCSSLLIASHQLILLEELVYKTTASCL